VDLTKFAFLDLVIVPAIWLIVALVAWMAPKQGPQSPFGDPSEAKLKDMKFEPMDPNNPYASPTLPDDQSKN
jgi:hypothetical protein